MKNEIIQIAKTAGIRDVGFCDFAWVEDRLINCRNKSRIPKNAKTVILFLFPYKVKEERPQNISRYAAVPDYHRVCGKYLDKISADLKQRFPKNQFEFFIDNSPIPEVFAAASAGLGLMGENRLLLTKEYGSWCFIGEIVTDLKIDCQKAFEKCSLCGNCKKACPTGVQGEICLSAVSQQKKELLDKEKELLIAHNIIWGCDICAESCPHNKNTKVTYIREFIDGYKNAYVLGEDIKNRAYEWRGEKVVSRNFKLINNEQSF